MSQGIKKEELILFCGSEISWRRWPKGNRLMDKYTKR